MAAAATRAAQNSQSFGVLCENVGKMAVPAATAPVSGRGCGTNYSGMGFDGHGIENSMFPMAPFGKNAEKRGMRIAPYGARNCSLWSRTYSLWSPEVPPVKTRLAGDSVDVSWRS